MVKKPARKPQPSKKTGKDIPKSETPPVRTEDVATQQLLLDTFRHAFADVLSSDRLAPAMQEVKQALFDRDFDRAFGTDEYLDVYAARWSPTRALCYESVLRRLRSHLGPLCRQDGRPPTLRVVSFGGGAAETVALGGFLRRERDWAGENDNGDGAEVGNMDRDNLLHASLHLLDSAPWTGVVDKLRAALVTPPPLSPYAGAAARAAHAAGLTTVVSPAESLSVSFSQQDALGLGRQGLAEQLGSVGGDGEKAPAPMLVTLLFTLNELFSFNVGKTTAFLLDLTATLPLGSLLLVVDSPGSYSEAVVGKQARRYPMQWLLDRILLADDDGPVEGRRWLQLESRDSVWFRLHESLFYPIPLEDMRYQMHLYRLEGTNTGSESTG